MSLQNRGDQDGGVKVAGFPYPDRTDLGYAKEYRVERLLREVLVTRFVPTGEQLILPFIAERCSGCPSHTDLALCR